MTRSMCMAAMCFLLSGCGELAYKTGGTTEQYRVAQKGCHIDDRDDVTYKACMKEKGWTVAGIEGSVVGTPQEVEGTAPSPTAKPQVSVESSANAPPTPSAAPQANTEPSRAPTAVKPAPRKAATLDPNEVVTVQSWWKYGPSDFKNDVHACADGPGGIHRYDETNKTATRALVGCMRTKGWRAY